ncbi:MAG: SDR family oxidoreductase [Beijerinckiaceae bacterium]|nr:SDR family oxidoreductase [Beijerinckiaceae bacterium]
MSETSADRLLDEQTEVSASEQKPVAIVTGGSRGIGRACALGLGSRGYQVIVNYAGNADAAKSVVHDIEAAGGWALAVQGDVGNEDDVKHLFEIADTIGKLAVLVNNAGVVDVKARVDEMSVERLTRMFTINVVGSFVAAREAVKRMSTKHGGSGGTIVNISSVAATLGSPGLFVDYAASKGAIDTFTKGLALEVADEGIRVNAVSPGLIATDIHASGGLPDRVAETRAAIPMKREGFPEEVAAAVLWLISDEASYATGANITISGGR